MNARLGLEVHLKRIDRLDNDVAAGFGLGDCEGRCRHCVRMRYYLADVVGDWVGKAS